MRWGWVLMLLFASQLTAKAPTKESPSAKPAKEDRPAPQAKVASAAKALGKDIESVCQQAWFRGDLPVLRRKCVQANQPETSASLYWGSLLATDPAVLRKSLSAHHLKALDSLDSRILLLAGRYQFSVGEVRELKDLAWLAAKRKLKDARIDTLRKLSEGK